MLKKDTASQLAFDMGVPADERAAAHKELVETNMPSSADMIPAADLMPIINQARDEFGYRAEMMQKAVMQVNPGGRKPKRGMQSVDVDDFQLSVYGDYFEKPSALDFSGLRNMVHETPILAAIINTRVRQVTRFCRASDDTDIPGFQIQHADGPDVELSAEEKESVKQLSKFVQNSGWEFNPRQRQRLKRDAFPHMIEKLVRDTLCMDSAAIETEMKRDSRKGIHGLYAVDGSTIRLCTEEGYEGNDELFAVQVLNGQVRSAYTYQDLIYVPRNPSTDIMLGGYGQAEPEVLVRVVTGFLNAMTQNITAFSENSIPAGVMHMVGDYDSEDLSAFKRYWNSMIQGTQNRWKVPVMVSKDQDSKASFEKFGVEFNEMYFAKWMTFLTSMACAVYAISPDEINFESFSAQKSSLSGEDTAEKLADSKDKGLRPLLSYLQMLYSDYIVGDFGEKYVFRWTGLDPQGADKRHELYKLVATIDETRAKLNMEPDPGDMGNAPINPSLLSAWQQTQQPEDDYGNPEDVSDKGGDFGQKDEGEDDQNSEIAQEPRKDLSNEPQGDFGKSLNVYAVDR